MKEELNIAGILKLMPRHIKLYSTAYGECTFNGIGCDDTIDTKDALEKSHIYTRNGFLDDSIGAECVLFPSKQMRDWEKFAWKKGDVLSSGFSTLCIFKKWANEEYTEFHAEFITPSYTKTILNTNAWTKLENEDTIKQYISKIEEVKGGKLNLETLEIEKPKQEFKDGDILYSNLVGNEVFIVKIEEKGILHSYVYMDIYNKVLNIDKDETFSISGCIYNGNIRLATDSEKQQLFSALAKEGKRWNPDTKTIEDLPKKCEFKAFDKVLVRETPDDSWMPAFFAEYSDDGYGDISYGVCGGNTCVYYDNCIPYNEETAHLLGTTDEWK